MYDFFNNCVEYTSTASHVFENGGFIESTAPANYLYIVFRAV